jgi:hypothetical protein
MGTGMTIPADAIRVASQIATIVGIGVAIVVFLNEKRQERRRRGFEAYQETVWLFDQRMDLCLPVAALPGLLGAAQGKRGRGSTAPAPTVRS